MQEGSRELTCEESSDSDANHFDDLEQILCIYTLEVNE